jgi:hypothetical protein
MVAAKETEDVSGLLDMNISRGPKAAELVRLREDCGEFLAMGRNTAITKMQRHRRLK